MQARNVAGTIVAIDASSGVVRLDSGEDVRFELPWDRTLRVGWGVLVTFDAQGEIIRVGLDLRPIGMTEIQASDLDNLAAQYEALTRVQPLTPEQRALFEAVLASTMAMSKQARQLRERLSRTVAGDPIPLTDDDPWAAAARVELATLASRDVWLELLALAGDGSKPTKKWLTAAAAIVGRLGVGVFAETVRRWFALVAPRAVVRDQDNWFTPAMGDANADALKNLVWACATVTDPQLSEQLATAIGDLAVRCFTKVPGVGALSTKGGNACIYVLSQLPGLRSVAQLSRLGARVRYKQALVLVDKAKVECAKRAGVAPIDLEEMSLPTFGLDVEGKTRVELGDFTAELAIVDDKAVLAFLDGDKRLKSVPAAVKSLPELAELKATQKELGALLPTVRARLERWMFEPRAWSLADLRARYLDHALVARLARRLIYATADTTVIFFDGFPVDATGKEVALTDDVQLTLWHPLERPAAEVAAWRSFLASIDVVQPFKQVERELYRAGGEAEEHESQRFAGAIVRQHQLAALLRERGWTYTLMGGFDGGNAPTKRFAPYDLSVELDLDVPADAPLADSGIYLQVTTGQLRFVRAGQAMRLGEVPARCFSEVMRDVDLFVSGALVSAGGA